MKLKKLMVPGAILLIVLLSVSIGIASEGHEEEEDDDHDSEIQDQCDNPTEELLIEADSLSNAYTENEITVKKNTCYEITFKNPSPTVEHDFTIDAVDDDEFTMSKVHIHVANNTDGHDGDGTESLHVLFPDVDTELEYYCTVAGHRAAGMEGVIIVGEGNSSTLPFNFAYSLIGIFLILPLVKKYRG